MTLRRAALLPACALPALTLAACATTAERSARIGAQGVRQIAPAGTIDVSRPNPDIRVRRAVVVRDGELSAAAVELQNKGSRAQALVPLVIDVRDRRDKSIYRNDAVGLQPSLQQVALVPAGRSIWWVNDQLLGATAPRAVHAKVGAARTVARAPRITLQNVHFTSDAAGRYLTGTVVNATGRLQSNVPVFAVALRGDRVVAAGRSLVPKLPVTSPKPVHFRLIFIGDPSGARIALTTAPTIVR